MLIDDEDIDRRVYQRVIDKSGLVERTLTFTYADEALAYMKDNPDLDVDVIFLDINMPRMNGFEFLDAVNRDLGPDFAKVVIAMLTTSLNPSDRSRAAEYEIVKEYISKPLTVEHVERVASYL